MIHAWYSGQSIKWFFCYYLNLIFEGRRQKPSEGGGHTGILKPILNGTIKGEMHYKENKIVAI